MRMPLVARWGKAARGLGVTLAVVSITAFVGLWTHGCENDRKRFQCGVPLDGDSSVTRACDGPNEVCICWTHACARRQSPDHVEGEANYCSSGFRYLQEPFGPPTVPKPVEIPGGETTSSTTETGSTTSTTASSTDSTTSTTTTIEPIPIDADLGECVPEALVEWSVIGTQLCKDSEHAPDTYPDAGTGADASTGGGGSGGTTSSGGGGTTSSGGGGTTSSGGGGTTTSSSGGTGGTTSGGGTGGATGGAGGAT